MHLYYSLYIVQETQRDSSKFKVNIQNWDLHSIVISTFEFWKGKKNKGQNIFTLPLCLHGAPLYGATVVCSSVRVRIYLAVRKRIFSSNKQKRNFACPEQASKRARKSRGRKVPDRREGAKTSTMLARGYWRCLESRIHEAALIETSLWFLKILVASKLDLS